MNQQQSSKKKKDLPTIPAWDWEPVHNEPSVKIEKDEMPKGDPIPGKSESKAVLRMKIEKLLQRREAAPDETWLQLGKDGINILLSLLDDVSVMQQPELRHKVIATLGQLNLSEAIADLGNILLSTKENELTQTYAASSLGRIDDPRIVAYLGRAIVNKHPMVRRQVAAALGKSQNTDAVPYLLKLQQDASSDVVLVAVKGLQQLQQYSDTKLKIKPGSTKQQSRKTKIRPKNED